MVSIMRNWFCVQCSRHAATLIACAWMALFSAIHSPASALAQDDASVIRALIGTTWDKPDSKVVTDPVIVSGDHAVASWTQGAHGGRALLRRNGSHWAVVLCSGDPLKHASWLVEAGVPEADANRIASALSDAEASVPQARRAMFSLFEGVVSAESDPTGSARHDHHAHQ
jgi:hypothetical protein